MFVRFNYPSKRTKQFSFSWLFIAYFLFVLLLWISKFNKLANKNIIVEAAIEFSTTNVEQFSLYQTAEVLFSSNTLQGDPPIITGDWFYFKEDIQNVNCDDFNMNKVDRGNIVNDKFYVTAIGKKGISGRSTVIVKTTIFTINKKYIICYVTNGVSYLVRRTVNDQKGLLYIWPSIYNTGYTTDPNLLVGGLQFVTFEVIESTQIGRSYNNGLTGKNTIFFLQCEKNGINRCINGINDLPDICANFYNEKKIIQLSNLKFSSKNKIVTGLFSVPYVPSADGYFICIPYCYNAESGCGVYTQPSYNVVVESDKPNYIVQTPSLLKFNLANPLFYSLTPSSPQVREQGYILFTGINLTTKDEITIIRAENECGSPSAVLLGNLEYGNVEVVSEHTKVRVNFIATNFITEPMKGRVCYRRSDFKLWSFVYKDPTNLKPDFIINVFQPTGFSLLPEKPFIGSPFTIFFTGEGLSKEDEIFLSKDLKCDNKQISFSVPLLLQDNFPCTTSLTKNNMQCTTIVNPPSNFGMTLYVCYRKKGIVNFASLNGVITLYKRNPTYTVTPYKIYSGQEGIISFFGEGLSLADSIKFIKVESLVCKEENFITSFSIANGKEIITEKMYVYNVVGAFKECLQVCYKIAGSNVWSFARPQDMKTGTKDCPEGNLFVDKYDVTYNIPYDQITAKETVVFKLIVHSAITFSTFKVVRAENKCALSFCTKIANSDGNDNVVADTQTTACSLSQHEDDFVLKLYQLEVQVFVAAKDTSYILCASNENEVFIPVSYTKSDNMLLHQPMFAFTTAETMVKLTIIEPVKWRVAFAYISTTFVGTNLNGVSDKVYAVLDSELLSPVALACKAANIIPKEALLSKLRNNNVEVEKFLTVKEKSTIATYSNSHLRKKGDVVHFCYIWSDEKNMNLRHVTYTGSIIFLERFPLEMKLTHPTHFSSLSSSYSFLSLQSDKIFRAGEQTELTFLFGEPHHSPISDDKVYFYRYASDFGRDCFCNYACLKENLLLYPNVHLKPKSGSDNEAIWMHPQGFNNYKFDANYVVCYNATNSGSATFMGLLKVGMAQPAYYSAKSTVFDEYRVGRLIEFKAFQYCKGFNCLILNKSNKMRLISVKKQCYEIVDNDANSNDNDNDNDVDLVGEPTSDGVSYTQFMVVNKEGSYRLCYNLDGNYQELTALLDTSPKPLIVKSANPISFTSTPPRPSAGSFITLQLNCNSDECKICDELRLVPGKKVSCWEEVKGTFTSDNCLTLTTIQFPNQYLTEGSYTVCYGSDIIKRRRILGDFVVLPANPSIFQSTSTEIYTNQFSDVKFTLKGESLTSKDKIFLLTNKGYSCHDLRDNKIQGNGTLRLWFKPSVFPNPIIVNNKGDIATWVSSSSDKRFDVGIIYDKFLCNEPGDHCVMQLCYMREKGTWAPVSFLAKKDLYLMLPNPYKAAFEKYPLAVGMYSGVKVYGKNLYVNDVVEMRLENCNGKIITTLVGSAKLNAEKTIWTGVVRFIERNMLTYAVCYTHDSSVTEITTVSAGDGINSGGSSSSNSQIVVLDPLYYMYNTDNISNDHEMTQYEAIMVAATFKNTAEMGLNYVEIININTECNYIPYSFTDTAIITNNHDVDNVRTFKFDVLMRLEPLTKVPYFGGRLTLDVGKYAFCMNITSGLFRVTTRNDGVEFIIAKANPNFFTLMPKIPFVDQLFQLTFTITSSNKNSNIAITTFYANNVDASLSVKVEDKNGKKKKNDLIQIIQGGLYDCGERNTTIFFEGDAIFTESPVKTVVNNIKLPKEVVGENLTVCYKRVGGTFSAVSYDGPIDHNLVIIPYIPEIWKTNPIQPQVKRTLQITFYGNKDYPYFLTEDDIAFLVKIKDNDVTSATCEQSATIKSVGKLLKIGINTMWIISAEKMVEGNFIVCYTAVKNGKALQVKNPLTLTVFSLQSPKGIFKNTIYSDTVNVFSGERFYLMFDSDLKLDPVLHFDKEERNKDAVLFSKTADCSLPLGSDDVHIIPNNFFYKKMEVKNPSGIISPYLHIVLRTNPGDFFVCMRRVGRHEGEAFFTFDAIGDLRKPALVKVTEMPIKQYTTNPTVPRTFVPSAEVFLILNPSYQLTNFRQLFFVTYNRINDDDNVIDDCYRPTAKEAAKPDAILLNETLQVKIGTTSHIMYPFPTAGLYHLCLQLKSDSYFTASVSLTSLFVANPSPTMYIVQDIISVGKSFVMGFTAIDEIFKPLITGNKVNIHKAAPDLLNKYYDVITPRCDIHSSIIISFDKLTRVNNTYATVLPKIDDEGFYYVCFLVFDQLSYFPVFKNGGDFFFAVGLTGAQSYVVKPFSAIYMGQLLSITIFGNFLTDKDTVKIVYVPESEEGKNYELLCTELAPNADAEVGGIAGSTVTLISKTQADYAPRVNKTGRFILCYKSVHLMDKWKWVSDLNSFTVDLPHPDVYIQEPTSFYVTEVVRLIIKDHYDIPQKGKLSNKDSIKLVERGAGKAGFDCSDTILPSKSIGVVHRIDAESSDTVAVYKVCANATVQVTVCYHLETGAWAEVPQSTIQPNRYIFNPVNFADNPFSGPSVGLSSSAPRPYETFVMKFSSSEKDVNVNYLAFALEPQEICKLNPSYVKPVYYDKKKKELSTFSVALAKAGTYQLYLGPYAKSTDPFIAHKQTFTVGSCDPCGFTPQYAFINNIVELKFPSASGTSFTSEDTLRIVSVISMGTGEKPSDGGGITITGNGDGYICDNPTGPFASLTLKPNVSKSSPASTVFNFFTGEAESNIGEYYLCYRKAGVNSNYAIVSDNAQIVSFSIYSTFLTKVEVCPFKPSYLETITLKISFSSDKYPKIAFSEKDEFWLLPPNINCDATILSITTTHPDSIIIIHPVLDKIIARNMALWMSTLPNGHVETKYTMCFRFAGDNIFHVLDQSSLVIYPQNPSYILTDPPYLESLRNPFKMYIYGQQLAPDDEFYTVDPSQSCEERCDKKITPEELPFVTHTQLLKNSTVLEVNFAGGEIKETNVWMAVCYRRANALLVRLAVYFFGDTNPASYKPNFVTRIGTRPLLTFSGIKLSADDSVIIVNDGTNCDETRAAAVGEFANAAKSGELSSFYLPLIGDNIKINLAYTVCYLVNNGVGFYVRMKIPLTVQHGGPSIFTTSNTPMLARSTEISFDYGTYTSKKGDEVILACAGCSCFDGNPATLPYGTVRATVTKDGETITLRVGMNERLSYAVCYRVFDSGYAQVGKDSIVPIKNLPSFAYSNNNILMYEDQSYSGIQTFYQGQRLTFTLTGFDEANDASKNYESVFADSMFNLFPKADDVVMLVTHDRMCWESPVQSEDGVLAKPSKVVDVTATQSTWRGLVPSLGPDAISPDKFPLFFTLCYQESGQSEFVAVPFPSSGFKMNPVDVQTFTTVPAALSPGMSHVNMTFPGAGAGDVAFIVETPGANLTTNHACDDSTSKIVSVEKTAFPFYTLSLSQLVKTSFLVVCHKRFKSTVAEVPKLLHLYPQNPSNYAVNIPSQLKARQRQYISFTFAGIDLDHTTDNVVFTDMPCADSPTWPPISSAFLRRRGDLFATTNSPPGTSVTVFAQFLDEQISESVIVHICYCHKKVWSEVGQPLELAAPMPTNLVLNPSVGVARVGQAITIELIWNDKKPITSAAVISANDVFEGSWCHNYTEKYVREPLLEVSSDSKLYVAIWRNAGPARVCVQLENSLWSDLALTPTGSVGDVIVKGPNLLSMNFFPKVPRVGQKVTVTFDMLDKPGVGDGIRITLPNSKTACTDLPSITGFAQLIPVDIDIKQQKTSVTLKDSTDELNYRSFNATGSFQVCYYSGSEKAWSLAGGSSDIANFIVSSAVPSKWGVENGSGGSGTQVTFAKEFSLIFEDPQGNLDPNNDIMWAVPKDQSCELPSEKCAQCIRFKPDKVKSTSRRVITQPAISWIAGKLNICYKLHDATAAIILPQLQVDTGDILCHVEPAVRIGQEQKITFKKRDDVDVLTDSWRVSLFDTDIVDCSKVYDPNFADGRAKIDTHNKSFAVYDVEWPVSMVQSAYRICYTHNGVARYVCSCEQISTQSGECYILTLPPSPLVFVSNPNPSYVGQWMELSFTLQETMINYPITDVKFVKKVNELSVCKDKEAFPIPPNVGFIAKVSPTLYVFKFKHNYAHGSEELIVCTLSRGLSQNYARVGTIHPEKSSNTWTIRPYLSLSMFPASSYFIRAMQTINLKFTHQSTEINDVVGHDDRVTFVNAPNMCNESVIDKTDPRFVLDIFMLDDTSFNTIPAPVLNPSNATRSSSVFVTFDSVKGLGKRYICYKLKAGTWAVVDDNNNKIDVLQSAVTECVEKHLNLPLVADNFNNVLRAMQYVQMTLMRTAEASKVHGLTYAIHVVPQTTPCVFDYATVFNSEATVINEQNILAIAFTPMEGMFKVCYRPSKNNHIIANWSPVCTKLSFTKASPVASYTGCLRLGQTLNVKAVHNSGLSFSKNDRFRFVPGSDDCIYSNGKTTVANTIRVGYKPQESDGTPVTTSGNVFDIPPTFFDEGTVGMRLCYKDSVGNEFAVPLDHNEPHVSNYTIAKRLILSIETQKGMTAGQRVLLTFNAENAKKEGPLKPYAELPSGPFKPIVLADDNKYDGATALYLSAETGLIKESCYKAMSTLYVVYGNTMQTVGFFDPASRGNYVACYKFAGCSVEDILLPLHVDDYNPAKWEVFPTQPRYGQLLRLNYFRNKDDPQSLPLQPGADRADLLLDPSSCWDLSTTDGKVVHGTTEETIGSEFFFPAHSPEETVQQPSKTHICYRIASGSWSYLSNDKLLLYPANPSSFTVLNFPARAMQINHIKFTGTSLGAKDRVKIISASDYCKDESQNTLNLIENSWEIINAKATEVIIAINSTASGDFKVCYRLETDSVWTLVYGNLHIYSRDPAVVTQTPALAAEGEVFTLNFTAADKFSNLSKDDLIALYSGNVHCSTPKGHSDAIVVSPSRTEMLPNNIFFQLAVGTRGQYTLCYLKGKYPIIVWGFETVNIIPNPWNYTVFPTSTVLRTNQLISSVFFGHGLLAKDNVIKTDQVKLIDFSNPRTNEACQTVHSAAKVKYYPLKANGTNSVQVVLSAPGAKESAYWVCYKLYGGRFYIMRNLGPVKLAEADPYGAKRTKSGDFIWDSESDKWTIETKEPLVKDDAFIFYSQVECNDFPYYEVPNPLDSESFPNGVAIVKDKVVLLRAGAPTPVGAKLSLCYYAQGVTTMLEKPFLKIMQGVPHALDKPVYVKAQEIFRFELAVTPTSMDYVVIVEDKNQCVGQTAPSSPHQIFIDVKNTSEHHITVTTAVDTKGTFYICYSHRVGHCATGLSQECARIVGTVVASVANPSGWLKTPETVFTTNTLTIQLLHPSAILGEARESEKLWLASIGIKPPIPSMEHVAGACIDSMYGQSRIDLVRVKDKTDFWTAKPNEEGMYALCYMSKMNLFPTIFSPLNKSGLMIYLTKVLSVTFIRMPTVGTETVILLYGGGLSQGDQLVAVGVADAESIPSDICINPSYTLRVNGVVFSFPHDSATNAYSMLFEKAYNYVLCFQPASSPTAPMVLITPITFKVTPMTLHYSLLSASLKEKPVELGFFGKKLKLSDLVALVPVPDTLVVTKFNDVCADKEYKAVMSVSEDQSTSIFRTVPMSSGSYAACYMRQGQKPLLLDDQIKVTKRTATGAVFTVVPKCTALYACSVQPVVTLIDASGAKTSDQFASIVMRLKLKSGPYVDNLLSGGNIWSEKEYSEFFFYVITVAEAGNYIMEAEITLSGGAKFFANSPSIFVKKTQAEQEIAVLTCKPVGIIERYQKIGSYPLGQSSIACVIQTTSQLAPTSYTVRVNAGKSTEVVPDKSKGLPRYTFTVFPDFDNSAPQFVLIYVEPNSHQGNQFIKNSPVIVRIGSRPDEHSTLSCVPDTNDFELPIFVRVNNRLLCHAQGRRNIMGTEKNIVAISKYMRIFRSHDSSSASTRAVNIRNYPENLGGKYEFYVDVSTAQYSVTVYGSVPSSKSSSLYTPMKGSPARFTVIGNPQFGDSSIICLSEHSASQLWFTPMEPFECKVTLRAGGHLVNGVPQDFLVKVNSGGTAQVVLNQTWFTTLAIVGTAPPSLVAKDSDADLNENFKVSVTFIPLSRLIAQMSGNLVYATSIKVSAKNNNKMLLMLTGRWLITGHKYGIRSSADCASGVESEATARIVNKSTNYLQLTVDTKSGQFYLCFAPSDQPTRWQLLSKEALVGPGGGGGGGVGLWTVLLIVGTILLAILLVLLALVIWQVCVRQRRGAAEKMIGSGGVYMAPRANYRFVRGAETTVVEEAQEASSIVPTSQQQEKRQWGQNKHKNESFVKWSARENDSQTHVDPVDDGPTRRNILPTGNAQTNTHRSRRGKSDKHQRRRANRRRLYDDLDSVNSKDEVARFITPAPPPQPPLPQQQQQQTTVAETTSTSFSAACGSSGARDALVQTGPYQYLQHKDQGPSATNGEVTGEKTEWIGSFVVRGHTSRPLVGSAASHVSSKKGNSDEKKTN